MENLNSQQVVFLVCLIVSLVFALFSLAMHIYFKRRQNRSTFRTKNYHGAWSFIKRNFWMYLSMVCFVLMISFSTFLFF